MTLEEHLRDGGDPPAGMEQLPDGRWRDPVDGWVGPAFMFDRLDDGSWRGDNRRTAEMRAAVALFAREKPLPWDHARREAYMAAWPAHAQLEALTDAAAGRPEKLARMQADFAAIKAANPKPKEK